MAENVDSILERLEKSEIDSNTATREIHRKLNPFLEMDGPYLRVTAEGVHNRRHRTNIKISLRLLGLGVTKVLPQLNAMDWSRIVDDLIAAGDGSILEIADHTAGERVTLSIEAP